MKKHLFLYTILCITLLFGGVSHVAAQQVFPDTIGEIQSIEYEYFWIEGGSCWTGSRVKVVTYYPNRERSLFVPYETSEDNNGGGDPLKTVLRLRIKTMEPSMLKVPDSEFIPSFSFKTVNEAFRQFVASEPPKIVISDQEWAMVQDYLIKYKSQKYELRLFLEFKNLINQNPDELLDLLWPDYIEKVNCPTFRDAHNIYKVKYICFDKNISPVLIMNDSICRFIDRALYHKFQKPLSLPSHNYEQPLEEFLAAMYVSYVIDKVNDSRES